METPRQTVDDFDRKVEGLVLDRLTVDVPGFARDYMHDAEVHAWVDMLVRITLHYVDALIRQNGDVDAVRLDENFVTETGVKLLIPALNFGGMSTTEAVEKLLTAAGMPLPIDDACVTGITRTQSADGNDSINVNLAVRVPPTDEQINTAIERGRHVRVTDITGA